MRAALALLVLFGAAPSFAVDEGREAHSPQTADLPGTLKDWWERLRGRPMPPIPVPADETARVVSWNLQALGKSLPQKRKEALRLAVSRLLAGRTTTVLAAQEVANEAGSKTLTRMLPDAGRGWTASFEDTSAAMNNAVYAGPGARVACGGNLALDGVTHPPHMAHVSIGAADFTLVSVHLTYAKGDASASLAELERILAWAREQAARPGVDPDFVIAGDFNLPTRRGKAASARAGSAAWTPLDEALGGDFIPLVDEPTSRSGRAGVANNYDHFLVSADFAAEELLDAGVLDAAAVRAAEAEGGARTSDHYPIAMGRRARRRRHLPVRAPNKSQDGPGNHGIDSTPSTSLLVAHIPIGMLAPRASYLGWTRSRQGHPGFC